MRLRIVLMACLAGAMVCIRAARADLVEADESIALRQKIGLGLKFVGLKDVRQQMHNDSKFKDLANVLPKWDSGIFILEVSPDGPADQAEIHRADIVTKIGDTPIKNSVDVVLFADTAQTSVEYPIVFFRYSEDAGAWVQKTTKLAGRPPRAENSGPASRPALPLDDPKVPHGIVSGGAWLTKSDGSSSVIRGLHIALLGRTIGGDRVGAVLQREIPKWHRRIEKHPDQDHADDEAMISQIDDFVQHHPAQMDLAKAYKILQAHSISGIADLPLDGAMKLAATDVDGKFSISAPIGDYYIYAYLSSDATWADWLVPVTIKTGQNRVIDLSDENAAMVRQSSGK